MPRRESVPEPSPNDRERRETEQWSVRSVASESHPNRNEDAVLVDLEAGVAGVFDGMGGHAFGDEASREAAGAVQRALVALEPLTEEDDDDVVRSTLVSLLHGAHRRVIDRGDELYRERYVQLSQEERAKPYRAPQTTAVLVRLRHHEDGRRTIVVASAGDSRAWRVGADGTLELLVADHDYLSNADERHKLEEKYGVSLTESTVARYREQLDEAHSEDDMTDPLGKFLFRSRNVVASSLGSRHGAPVISTSVTEVRPGDVVLLTSDGVHGNITVSRMRELAALASGPEELVELVTTEAGAVAGTAPRTINKGDIAVRAHRDDVTAVASIVS